MISTDRPVATQFSEVALRTDPWNKPANSLGFYSSQSLAERVANFVRNISIGEFSAGIDISINNRSTTNEIHRSGEKLCFQDTPSPGQMVAIHTISRTLDREEVIRIVDRISTLKEMEQRSFKPNDAPIFLQRADYYVMYDDPTNTETPLGMYSSEIPLRAAINFLSLLNINYGYELEQRDVVVYESGHKAAFMQSENQSRDEEQSLMRVADRFDLAEAKRIIRSLGYEESNGRFLDMPDQKRSRPIQ